MSKDVQAAREKVEHEQHAEAAAAAECAENEEDRDNTCLQLMPMEDLVPLSQSLISPTLARLFKLNTQPPSNSRSPLPQRCAGANPNERLDSHTVELQRMQQLQEDDLIRRLEEDDHPKHSTDDPCRMHIMVSAGSPLQEGKGGTIGVGFKRSYVIAGLSDSYGMHLSDADTPEDQAEVYSMNQLVERENSSNSGEGGAGSGGNGAGSSGARTLKRPRLVWTPQLHKRFVDAVSHLGIKHAVPKTIMQLMNVDGLTRENVASHLQKYRLYLRRVQQGSLFSSCSNSPTKSILGGLDHSHHHSGLIGAPISPVGGNSGHLFSSSEIPSTNMASANRRPAHTHNPHHLPGPINHLIPQHMPNVLLQPVPQHQLSQAMAMVKSSPFNITHQHLDPRCFTTNSPSSSPIKKAAWPSPHASFMDISAGQHSTDNHSAAAPTSPPRRALTLFPH